MKVAQICPRYHPFLGGIETHVRQISEALESKRIEVEVLTTDPTGKLAKEEMINGVRIRRFKSYAPKEAFYFSSELKSYLKSHYSEYDVIHAHSYHDFPALYCAQAKQSQGNNMNDPRTERTGKLFVFTPHYHGKGRSRFTTFLHLFYKPLFGKKIFNEANIIVCVSKFEAGLVVRDFPDAKDKAILIPNGVSPQNKSSDLAGNAAKKESNFILYVGRLEPYKRVDRLVRALADLSRNDIRLVIVGSGPSKEKILEIARDLRVENRISIFENLTEEELGNKYENASVVVNLSKFEAYGLTIAEALARGTPCVVSKSSALMEWVDGTNCFGVEDSDRPELVAMAIEEAMKTRVTVLKLETWDDIATRLLEAYQRNGAH